MWFYSKSYEITLKCDTPLLFTPAQRKKTVEKNKEYVVIHVSCIQDPNKILLIHKDRPEWQKGRINYVGGKVEVGESYQEAAFRELKEETGISVDSMSFCGLIKGCGFVVHCFSCQVDGTQEICPREGETELVEWCCIEDVVKDPKLMDNLKIIIPLIRFGISSWRLKEVTQRDWVVLFD
jgi:8-oxo-dGTP diphosphatase